MLAGIYQRMITAVNNDNSAASLTAINAVRLARTNLSLPSLSMGGNNMTLEDIAIFLSNVSVRATNEPR
jgi:hypothetical protein